MRHIGISCAASCQHICCLPSEGASQLKYSLLIADKRLDVCCDVKGGDTQHVCVFRLGAAATTCSLHSPGCIKEAILMVYRSFSNAASRPKITGFA